jgi:predicted permease
MTPLLLQTFVSTLLSILQIFFILLVPAILVRKKLLTQEHIRGLTAAMVDVFLPCLSFTSIISKFRPGRFELWWVLPLSGIAMAALGLFLGWLLFFREFPGKRNMVPLAGIQNGSFLILPLGAVLFSERFEEFSMYVFLFVMGQSLAVWTVGKQLATTAPDSRLSLRGIITPPMVATVSATALVLAGAYPVFFMEAAAGNSPLSQVFFATLFDAAKLLGQATVPLSLFILGGVLGSITIAFRSYFFDFFRVILVKFVLVPLITIAAVYFSGIWHTLPLLAVFFVIESSSAPATLIIIQVKKYGGDEQKIGSILLYCYLLCLFVLPVWVTVWNLLTVE